jgi:hypothetical protein
MARRGAVVLAAAVAVLVVAAFAVFLLPRVFDTRLIFQVQDAVSNAFVWDATVTLQNREMRLFYQSDRGPVPLVFDHLTPGTATLAVSAPDYIGQELTVRLHPGTNRLPAPIALIGAEIPGLDRFSMFETATDPVISVEIRPIDAAGKAIIDHPCMNLWIGARVSQEVVGDVPVSAQVDSGARRGRTIFVGKIPWTWDAAPSSDFRYHATIARSSLLDATPYLVIDYLVIVPVPGRIDPGTIDAFMKVAPDLSKTEDLAAYLTAHGDGSDFHSYFSTSWNVPSAPR